MGSLGKRVRLSGLRGFESHTLRVTADRVPADRVTTDDDAMRLALAEARTAEDGDEVPVGAVVLKDGELLASRHNERQRTGDPTAHAEVLALRDAADRCGTWRLDGVTVVTTLEPCLMCAGAILASRAARVVFGAFDPKAGAALTLYGVLSDPRLNHQCEVVGGVLADECGAVLSNFFSARR